MHIACDVACHAQGDIGEGNVTCRQSTNADKPDQSVTLEIQEPVTLTFALRYLNSFAKVTRSQDWHTRVTYRRQLP